MTMRVFAPVGGGQKELGGITYKAAEGGYLDVPEPIALVLVANGWVRASVGSTDTTANRPTNPAKNTHFIDTTLGYEIVFDGKTWRNKATGAAV